MQNPYETIYTINNEHKVYLVKNIQDGSLGVKKELNYYDLSVYKYLKKGHFAGVPAIIEFYEEDQKLIVFEEYIDGLSIEDMLAQGKRFSKDETRDIIMQLCLILKNLNRSIAFVHRDIKPSNLILKNDQLYLIDFNTAKFVTDKSRDTTLLGTEGYAAPEQYGFGSSSIQSDIYAIGILMREMLTGKIEETAVLDDELGRVIDRCLKMDPKDRYQNYDELIGALKGKDLMVLLKRYAPVGLRNENPLLKTAIICWYTIIAYIGLTMTMTSDDVPVSSAQLLVFRIGIALGLFLLTQFTFNYRNCQSFLKKRPFWLRMTVIAIVDYLILFLSIMLPAIVATLV